MSTTDDTLPTADTLMKKIALARADEASARIREKADAEAAKQEMLDRFSKPSGFSDDEVIRRANRVIENAVRNGLTEVQVFRFPSGICTDGGRAINQRETGWETTLVGIPKEIYQFWARHLRDKGYGLKVEIVDYPGGKPGDVAMTLRWG